MPSKQTPRHSAPSGKSRPTRTSAPNASATSPTPDSTTNVQDQPAPATASETTTQTSTDLVQTKPRVIVIDRAAPVSVQFCDAMQQVGLGPDDIALGLFETLANMKQAPVTNASSKLRFDSLRDAARLYESFAKSSERDAARAQATVQLIHCVARPVRALPPAGAESAPLEDIAESVDDGKET